MIIAVIGFELHVFSMELLSVTKSHQLYNMKNIHEDTILSSQNFILISINIRPCAGTAERKKHNLHLHFFLVISLGTLAFKLSCLLCN